MGSPDGLRGRTNQGFNHHPSDPTKEKSCGKNQNDGIEDSEGGGVEMKRELGLFSGMAIIVGTMIGSGIFVSPGGVLRGTGSVGLSLVVWAGCGLVCSLGAICYIELGCLIPQSGGETVYLKAGLGNFVAFLFSWMRALVICPSSCAIISLAFSEYALAMVPGLSEICGDQINLSKKLIAACTILIITFVNIVSVKWASRMQNVFTVAKLAAVAAISGGGILNLYNGMTSNLEPGFKTVPGLSEATAGSVAVAFYSGLWSYDGWNQLNYVTEELKDPMKNLPRAILLGIPMVTILYVLVNISYLSVLTPLQITSSYSVAQEWAEVMFGQLSWIMPLSVALSTFGAINSTVLTAGRSIFAAGREGYLPNVLSFINIHWFTPFPAILLNCAMGLCMIFAGNSISNLIDFFSFTAWIFYGLAMLSLIVMRWTKKDAIRPFKVWIILPIFVFLISCYFVVTPVIDNPAIEYLYVLSFMMVGVVMYLLFVFTEKFQFNLGGMNTFLQKLFYIVPPTTSNL